MKLSAFDKKMMSQGKVVKVVIPKKQGEPFYFKPSQTTLISTCLREYPTSRMVWLRK